MEIDNRREKEKMREGRKGDKWENRGRGKGRMIEEEAECEGAIERKEKVMRKGDRGIRREGEIGRKKGGGEKERGGRMWSGGCTCKLFQ
jgi:hypothetical protein